MIELAANFGYYQDYDIQKNGLFAHLDIMVYNSLLMVL